MSFVFDHSITITRPGAALSQGVPVIAGDGGYGTLSRNNETPIYGQLDNSTPPCSLCGIPAAMKAGSAGVLGEAREPGGTVGRVSPYRFIVQPSLVPRGTVKVRDYITDETGQRYQVIMPIWNGLECNLHCEPIAA